MRTSMLIGVAMAVIPLVACESVESTEVLTDGMHATLSIESESEASGARASAILRVGGATSNTFVELEGDDVLEASDGTDAVVLTEENLGDIFTYTGQLGQAAPGTEYTFSFTRSVDAGAPASTVTLPDAFEISGPTSDGIFSRTADDITVSWTPASTADKTRVSVEGDCTRIYVQEVDGDPGTWVIPAGELSSNGDPGIDSCDAEIFVRRYRVGELDAGWGEGSITASQLRSVKVRIDP